MFLSACVISYELSFNSSLCVSLSGGWLNVYCSCSPAHFKMICNIVRAHLSLLCIYSTSSIFAVAFIVGWPSDMLLFMCSSGYLLFMRSIDRYLIPCQGKVYNGKDTQSILREALSYLLLRHFS